MSKRFPIPEFDRDAFKNRPWSEPARLDAASQQRLRDAARRGDTASFGAHAIAVDAALAQRFKFEGPHLHALLCLLPHRPVRLVGRSWAWPIQRALVLDGADAAGAQVIADWITPRPMNTRLGPAEGISLPGGPVVVLLGNRVGERWVGNRTLVTADGVPPGAGFAIASASGEENDFHACNLTFDWS
jgi:hypothetical protein